MQNKKGPEAAEVFRVFFKIKRKTGERKKSVSVSQVRYKINN